jgi:maleylpyruvate isomerase
MTARTWMADGTTLFLDNLTGLDGPSLLPGWTRRHLVAHVHFNALALARLASWARTGVESRMYASREQRAAEIGDGAGWDAAVLRSRVRESAEALAAALDALPDKAWRAVVVTAQGRTFQRRRSRGCAPARSWSTPSTSAPASPTTTYRPTSSPPS